MEWNTSVVVYRYEAVAKWEKECRMMRLVGVVLENWRLKAAVVGKFLHEKYCLKRQPDLDSSLSKIWTWPKSMAIGLARPIKSTIKENSRMKRAINSDQFVLDHYKKIADTPHSTESILARVTAIIPVPNEVLRALWNNG
ncbi:hypothetical protein RRG08_005983 [Elysia crispata]|uniref:Uncharacterized protein n=1 Tax=Elysia crispata TaxID=231223 RepID=A0AAE0YPL8_9GAST|nr:hypothetical protein RRG08_005983 [Elysia crispata]